MARAWRSAAVICLAAAACYAAVRQDAAVQADDPLASVVLPRENKALEGRLKFARKLAADRKWSEAVDVYADILRRRTL